MAARLHCRTPNAVLDEALRLRRAGVSWDGVAARLGYSWPAHLQRAIKRRDGSAATRAERPARADALRRAGHSWRDIATRLGYASSNSARVAWVCWRTGRSRHA